MIARGALGNPWVFEELTGRRAEPPRREEVVAELLWTIDRAEEHLGSERATRYLRKFYPWYVDSLQLEGDAARELQQSADLDRARELVCAGAGRDRSPQAPEISAESALIPDPSAYAQCDESGSRPSSLCASRP